MIRNQAYKLIDAMVSSAVKPAWAGMAKAVKEIRPKIEPKIRDLTEPIFKAEIQIVEKMKSKFVYLYLCILLTIMKML